jgi:diguanylate cyclase (GGDEF)-like protein
VAIETRIEDSLETGAPLAVLYVDINQFKAYNDAYGYDAGDQVIKAMAQLLLCLAREDPARKDFIGHIGGDDFILLTVPSRMEPLAKDIIRQFDAIVPAFYNEEDRKRGKILSNDRQGRAREFALLSVSIGICHNRFRRLTSYPQISQYGAELKKFAKQQKGSAYVLDRRRD